MVGTSKTFPALFKRYRLKAEFATLSELGNALAEKGHIYEDSIFSHWQKGTKTPQNRSVLLKLLEIFIEKGSITTLEQANEFMTSTNQGYLSEKELEIFVGKLHRQIFQVPNETINFSNRQEIISYLAQINYLEGKVVIIHGAPGVGKTSLAIKLGHILRSRFKDGILWYKVEEDNLMDILFSIAHVFGEDTSNIRDKQVKATIVRSLLANKNVLLFLDSGELCDDVHLLIPNSKLCTTIITSQKSHLKVPIDYIDVLLKPFTDEEVVVLFKETLKDKYLHKNTDTILKIAKKVGNLPLALHIIARQILHEKINPAQLQGMLNRNNSIFQDMYYEDKNLYLAIEMSYKRLELRTKSVLASASIFKGKDFSVKSIGYINGLSTGDATKILQTLVDLSLIEQSTGN